MDILSLVLHGPTAPHPKGSPIPIRIEVRNVSPQSIWMVGIVDGSENGTRYPHYLPQIRLGGRVIAAPPSRDDPPMGPLRLTDFVSLEPGASFDPTARAGARYFPLSTFANFLPTTVGRYEFQLKLSTESARPEQWLGRVGQDVERPAVLDRLQLIPRVTIASNTLAVEIVR